MKKLGGIVLLVVLCFSLVGCGNDKEEPLTEIEQYAVDCINEYKSKIANPDELKVHDIRWQNESQIREAGFLEDTLHIYIDKSFQNESGGYTRNIGLCRQYGDIFDYYADYSEKSTQSNDKQLYNNWLKIKKEDNAKISVDRVMKNVD